ncbi:MAG: iron ABC transporter permease, partial [Leptolyngbyaceae cyanobacterium SM1_3_5]|nr:iron ABC transporter permease [Leptolyngbyaceae cyanobacterium SM1_3_5]
MQNRQRRHANGLRLAAKKLIARIHQQSYRDRDRSILKSIRINSFRPSGWTLLVAGLAALVAVPVLVVLSSVFSTSSDLWGHLAATVLPRYIANSFGLMVGVGSGVAIVGVGTAWLVTMCRFPGSRILEWALLLPLAAPAYLLAYTYTELLDYYGIVQRSLRTAFGWRTAMDYWFPDVRSLGGAIVLLTLVLYPYVYLLVRTALIEQSVCTLEASRVLGCNPWRSFWRVALPLARPSVASGVALALMETLSDYGTVQYFGVDTFTIGIYRTWFGMGDRTTAAQLAALLMLFVLALVLVEQWFRRQQRYYQGGSQQPRSRYVLTGWRAAIAQIACVLPLLLGFVLPAGLLLQCESIVAWATRAFGELPATVWFWAARDAAIGVAIAL